MKKLFFFLSASILLMSCENDIGDIALNKSIETNSNKVSLSIRNPDDAKSIAIQFITDGSWGVRTKSSSEVRVKDVDVFRMNQNYVKSTYSSEDGNIANNVDTFLYAVNFDDKSSVIVSANKSVPPILATFENNFYFKDLQKEENSGVQYILETISENLLEYIEKNRDEQTTRTRSVSRENENDAGSWTYVMGVSPKVKVAWDQGDPFNKYTPIYSGTSHSPVGCVALAIGQAMTVLKPVNQYRGITLDWNKIENIKNASQMRTNPNQADIIARYLYNIGSSFGTKYGKSSSANTESALKTTSRDFNYNYTSIKGGYIMRIDLANEYKPNNIIIMRGNAVKKKTWIFFNKYEDGHCFIVDGYKRYKNNSYNTNDPYYFGTTYYTVYSVNLGWGSSYNGYFLGSFTYRTKSWEHTHIDEEPDRPDMYEYNEYEEDLFWKETADNKFQYKMNLYLLSNK